jgi:hypothetical protein
MDAPTILDAYVHDVARELPARKRDDVAFELRGLLNEELQEKADATGRPPDPAMAMELVRAHGRPAEVAARYHTPFTIIEPSDTRGFALGAAVGAAGILLYESITPVEGLRVVGGSARDEVAFLAWLGLLGIGFAVKNLVRRRWPGVAAWKPRAIADANRASRLQNVLVALVAVAALVLYVAPTSVLVVLPAGIVDPGSFAYSADFQSPLRMSWLVGMLAAVAVLHLVVAARRRWTRWMRWIDIALAVHVAIQLGWHVRYGNIFANPETELSIRPVIWLAATVAILYAGVQIYREWNRVRPSPNIGRPVVPA